MANGRDRWAVFAPPGAGSIVVREGGSVGEWRVREVRPGDGVVVDDPDTSLLLRPAFLNGDALAMAAGIVVEKPAPAALQSEPEALGNVVASPGPVPPATRPRLPAAFFQRGFSNRG